VSTDCLEPTDKTSAETSQFFIAATWFFPAKNVLRAVHRELALNNSGLLGSFVSADESQ
jgi:hypothetical protein